MDDQEKITDALQNAINHLERAIQGCVEQEGDSVDYDVWRAASDVEYAVFLLSINSKIQLAAGTVEKLDGGVGAKLAAAKDDLQVSLKELVISPAEACRLAWRALDQLSIVQKELSSKRLR